MAENSSIFCTICEHDLSDGVIHTHIHEDLGVAVCDPCFKRGHGVSIEPEKRSECCNWCGEIGDSNLFQCGAPKTDSEACERCFCEDCIRRNLGQEELDRRKAPDDDDWCCYCCNDEPLVCKQRELKFFMESNDSSADEDEEEREGKSIQGGKAGTENDEQLQHKIQRKLQRLRDVEEWLGEAAEELDKEDATLEDAIVMELQAQLGSEADQADIVDRAQDEIEVRRRMWGERQDALLDRQAELVEALQALTGLNERELYVQLGLLPDKSHEALPPSHTREEEEDIQAVLEERKNSLEFEREQKSGQEWLEFAKKILSKLEEQESNDNGTMAKAAATMKDKLPTLTNKLANAQNRNEPFKRVREARNELKLLVTNVIDNSWEQFKDEELMTPYIRRELLAFANEVNGKEVQALANSDEQVIDDVLGEGDFAAALTNTINNKSADVSLLSHYKKHLKSEDDLLHEQQGKHQLQLNTVGEDGDKTEDQENLQSEVKERQNERVLAKRRVVDDSVKREANRAQRKRKAAARKKAEAASAAAAAAAAAAAEVRDRKGKKRSRLSLSQKKPAAEDEVVNLVESDEEYNEERTMGARGLPRQKKCMRCRRQPATKAVLVPSENGDVDAGSDRWDVCSECEAKFIWQRTKKKAKHGDEEDEEELKQPSSDAGNESEENNCDRNLAEAKYRGYQKQSSFKEASGAPSDPVVPPGEGARTPSPPLPGNGGGGGGGAGGRAASPPPPGRRRRPRPPLTANCPGCGERIAEGEEVWWVRAREGGDEVQKKLCAICTAMADSLGQLLSKRQILPDKQSNNNIKSDDQDDTDIKKKIDEQLKQGSSRKHTHLSSKGSKQDWWQSSDSSSAEDERRKSAPIKSSVRNSASSSSGSEFELEDDGKAPAESKSEQEVQNSFNYTQMKRAPKTSRDTPIYVDDTDDDEEEDNDDSPVLQSQVKRRDIAPILADAQLKPTTLHAMAAEEARRRRLQERAQRPARLRAGKDKGKGKAPGRTRPAGSAGSPAAMDWEEQGPVAHEEETDAEAGGGEEGLVLERDDRGRPLVTVDFELTHLLKPHQREGVQFMYDNVIERLAEIDKGPGFGAILAHCMGLGKTFQVVVLVYTLLTNQEVRRAMEASKSLQTMRTALILAPSNVTTHWMEEFNKWVPGKLRVWTLGKNAGDRQRTVNVWRKRGGVLIMSHSLFRSLAYEEPKTPDSVEELNNSSGGEETSGAGQCSATATVNSKGKKKMRPVEQWAREAFLTPGPDLLVCDEAHVVKNLKAKFSKVIKAVRTRRRLALTGSPMQNNLKEYYTMVDFVRENLLGTPDEFANRFENPIKAGSYEDSSQYHKEIMKRRSHVLHEILKGLVLRRDVSVLSASLPPKSEYVISVKLSKLQKTIQSIFRREWKKEKMNILKLYAKLLVVWGHPAAIKLEDIKEDDETEYDQEYLRKLRKIIEEKQESGDLKLIETGSKVVILLELLAKSMQLGDKVLVFSQSLRVISYIEAVLCGKDWARGLEATPPENFGAGVPFKKNVHYYRLDGSVDSRERQVQFKSFNGSSKAKVFLVSTKAGNMGANLFGANRVVIFDSSFNPANDLQAMFRAYRYGQRKPVYVYRLLAHRSMEEKIYTRQVNKAGLAGRVIDDKQIKQMFTTQEIEDLTSMDKEEVNDPLSGLKNALSSPDPNSQNESSPHQGGQNDSSSSPIQWLSQTGRNIVSKTMKPFLKAVLGSPRKGVMDSFHERHREAFQGGGAAGRPGGGGGGGGGGDAVLAHLLRLERSLVATHHPHEKCLEDAPQESLTAEQSAAAMREYEEERDRPPPLLLGLGGGGGGRRGGGGSGALLRGGGGGGAANLSGPPATWGGGGPPLPHQMDENGRYVRPPPPPPPSEAAPVFGAEAAAQRVAVLQARGGAIAGHSEGLQGWSKTVLQDLREQELAAVLEASCSFCLRYNLTCDNGYPKCSNCSSRGYPCRNVIRTNPPAQQNPSQQGGVASGSVGGDGNSVDQEMIVDFTL